jgi:hypothetical protein
MNLTIDSILFGIAIRFFDPDSAIFSNRQKMVTFGACDGKD